MRVGVVSVYQDHHRQGNHGRGVLQPLAGTLIAGLLPEHAEVELVNDVWGEPDWSRDYDLLLISCLHPDFDRARQISHYWRRRGATTVLGGNFATQFPDLCQPFFDAVVVGHPERTVPRLVADFEAGALEPRYVGDLFEPSRVPVPRYDLVNPRHTLPISVEASRGCPFRCAFCVLTGMGTHFVPRPIPDVVRDIRAAQRLLNRRAAPHKRNFVVFLDNNLGGDPAWLRQLCAALCRLEIRWGASVSFNVIDRGDLVREMSESGCRFVFVGLESLNPKTLSNMHKYQNRVDHYRRALEQCARHGISVASGIILDAQRDDVDDIVRLPERLDAVGLAVPTFLGFESPTPGTPLFDQMASGTGMMPGAFLRDFSGYTLVVRPPGDPEVYLAAYRDALRRLFAPGRRARKLLSDAARHLRYGFPYTSAIDILTHLPRRHPLVAGRTYIAGTDTPPPERVPLSDSDFESAKERDAVLHPWSVTDGAGRPLPHWLPAGAERRAAGARQGAGREAAGTAPPPARAARSGRSRRRHSRGGRAAEAGRPA